MKHIQKLIETHPLAERTPHSWAFERSKEDMDEFAWPTFEFDLNEVLEEERSNDRILAHMSAHLSRGDGVRYREH